MGYCAKENRNCDCIQTNGECSLTACINKNFISNDAVPNVMHHYKFTRQCEICGKETEDENHYLCARCRLKLHDLLYNDSNWGKGDWC